MKRIKIVIDVMMSVILLFLMAFQVTGDKYHEWIGAGMLILFIVHNTLNIGWYKAFFKGRYSALRVFRTVINILVLAAILLTGYSGIVMSRHVFAFLPISGGMATARRMHLACSYWAFVLMSVHLGMHWGMLTGKCLRGKFGKPAIIWIMRIASAIIAVAGAYFFASTEALRNMFLQNEFAVLDYETAGGMIILENLMMMFAWAFTGNYLTKGLERITVSGKREKKALAQGIVCVCTAIVMVAVSVILTPAKDTDINSWGTGNSQNTDAGDTTETVKTDSETDTELHDTEVQEVIDDWTEITNVSDRFVYISGGTYDMGSPDSENWRSADETLHTVTVSNFYMSAYEVTQEEYETVMGNNPSNFIGEDLPVENVSWRDAVLYCNARSEKENLTPVYIIQGDADSDNFSVAWDRGANGYRLPTEAEWEYACRAGTTTPFNTKTSISADEANYYGHYPYEIEGNYFEQDSLSTKPGQYRETTVEVDSFSPNAWGLYNMHGNVSEWVWDYYGPYDQNDTEDPTGPISGNLKVYRGGGWNDFAKNLRSAYRATLEEDMHSFNIGIRLVRNAFSGTGDIIGEDSSKMPDSASAVDKTRRDAGKVLIAYFSWGGNTKGVAEEIQAQTGADIFEITLADPYSTDYNTVLDQAQHDQNIQARPEIENHVEHMEDYDTILLGYPNWWASIPMPIASFLEDYDFSGKNIIPFCSHGGGRFGQSLTAIAKLAPNSTMGEGLSIHYSGGSTLPSDVEEWLKTNGIIE